MDTLVELIRSMRREEIRRLKLYARGEAKSLQLFDFLRRSDDEQAAAQKLYPGAKDKNAYYRLKNRLAELIEKSQADLHSSDSRRTRAVRSVLLARVYLDKNMPEIARRFLLRAEKDALAQEDFELLDLIYGHLIQTAQFLADVHPQAYVERRRENARRLDVLRETEDWLAVVNFTLKINQNIAPEVEKIPPPPPAVFEPTQSLRLAIKFFDARVKWLLHLRDYAELENYVRQTFETFERQNLFDESTQADKLRMLTYLINALYKNDKIEQAAEYVERLGREIEAYDRKYYRQYSFFYYNSLVYAYSRTRPLKAIEVLRFLKTSEVLKQNEFYTNFVYTNLAYLLYEQKRYAEAAKELTQLYLTDVYKAAGEEFRFKVAVTECIIRFEMGDPDAVERRIEQIRREYAAILENYERERRFLELLFRLCGGIKPKTRRLAQEFLERFAV
ncbi:MAG: hypothetical protein RMM53_09350, partial [Bacteroidia bacterium]|nr:hypothetical protein [Bacteroidia bacterium]